MDQKDKQNKIKRDEVIGFFTSAKIALQYEDESDKYDTTVKLMEIMDSVDIEAKAFDKNRLKMQKEKKLEEYLDTEIDYEIIEKNKIKIDQMPKKLPGMVIKNLKKYIIFK